MDRDGEKDFFVKSCMFMHVMNTRTRIIHSGLGSGSVVGHVAAEVNLQKK